MDQISIQMAFQTETQLIIVPSSQATDATKYAKILLY